MIDCVGEVNIDLKIYMVFGEGRQWLDFLYRFLNVYEWLIQMDYFCYNSWCELNFTGKRNDMRCHVFLWTLHYFPIKWDKTHNSLSVFDLLTSI